MDKINLMEERRARRTACAEVKRRAADALKDKGNILYRNGEYAAAVKCYEDAVTTYGPKAVYMTNLAAALLKLEQYEEAAMAAKVALERNPKSMKARFRRGTARKGLDDLSGALSDFSTVLRIDPECKEAQDEVLAILGTGRVSLSAAALNPENPFSAHQPFLEQPARYEETPVPSDSEDYQHEGNNIPCRFYNRDGCNKGNECEFSHAPDNRSVRDDLGRNVCLFYLAGLCKFDATQCVYVHDNTCISDHRFRDPTDLQRMCDFFQEIGAAHSAQTLEKLAHLFKDPVKTTEWLPRQQLSMSNVTTQVAVQILMQHGGLELEDLPITLWPMAQELQKHSYQEARAIGPSRKGKDKIRTQGSPDETATTCAVASASLNFVSQKSQSSSDSGGKQKLGGFERRCGIWDIDLADEDEDEDDDDFVSESDLERVEAEMEECGKKWALQDLLSYGFKPWEEGAWDILRAIDDM